MNRDLARRLRALEKCTIANDRRPYDLSRLTDPELQVIEDGLRAGADLSGFSLDQLKFLDVTLAKLGTTPCFPPADTPPANIRRGSTENQHAAALTDTTPHRSAPSERR